MEKKKEGGSEEGKKEKKKTDSLSLSCRLGPAFPDTWRLLMCCYDPRNRRKSIS